MSDKRNDTWVDSLMASAHPEQGSVSLSHGTWSIPLPRPPESPGDSEETLAEGTYDALGGGVLPMLAASLPAIDGLPERYEDLGPLGEGGMGEVRRVRDRELNRTMALKVIRPDLRAKDETLARFVEEAQVTAQLQHPGIVPVHELGRLTDGRLYFTMQEVRGRTLREVIRELHAHARAVGSRPTPSGWTFRRLIDAFFRVCETVAYAHARGVVHRDLKPQNIMVGEYGAVLVLDWGLAKVLGRDSLDPEEAIETTRTSDNSYATRQGRVSGTPAYMPPEQAQGRRDLLGPASDVWSLGAVLFEILSGRAPFRGADAHEVMHRVVSGEVEALEGALPVPEELEAVVTRAMSPQLEQRYPDANAMARELSDWLEGARRQEQALAVVLEADAILPQVAELQADARALTAEARAELDPLPPHAPAEKKTSGWRKEDRAAELENQARLVELTYVRKLYSALNLAPELPEAHDRLADYYQARHVEAEAQRDEAAAARQELQLRAHDRGRHAAYLEGTGALTLLTDPPGAEARLHRYELIDRRLVPLFERSLGPTPLRAVSLQKGSYLITLHHPERAEVRYPVLIERGEHWDGVAPGESEPTPVALPRVEDLAEDDCYVPAGWFISGGDVEALDGLPRRRIWVDAFVIKRFPVTNGQYLDFLNDLVASGRADEAVGHAPSKDMQATQQQGLQSVVSRDSEGSFLFRGEGELAPWDLKWPISLVQQDSASAYAAWQSGASRVSWRLPHDLEWEKAARSVDGRLLPWGEHLDPTWACFAASHVKTPQRRAATEFPLDESPYGVQGLVGGMRDWCLNGYLRAGIGSARLSLSDQEHVSFSSDYRMVRGGAWATASHYCRPAGRFANHLMYRSQLIGFRLTRSLGEDGSPPP